jgi:MbtH protein
LYGFFNLYRVLINLDEQYGILPARLGVPDGWEETGIEGTVDQCKAWVEDNWRDMRPLGLQRFRPEPGVEQG